MEPRLERLLVNKSKFVKILAASLAVSALLLTSSGAQGASKPKDRVLWSQLFSDKKVGARLDSRFFSYEIGNGGGWGNQERQYYTNKSSNVSMDGKGRLVITARKLDPYNPKDQYITDWCGNCVFSSARVVTRDKLGFKYGTMSARMQIPAGVGMWPAFWMLGAPRDSCNGWPSCGEIDIMEARGSSTDRTASALHGPEYSGGSALVNYFYGGNTDLSAGYHVYRVDWKPNSIKFYVDGQFIGGRTKSSIAPKEWVFNAEFYLILNLATGGTFDGGQLDETIEKAELKIDWIKYGTLDGYGQLIRR